MARSLWRGSLSFGLVNVPVALVSGVRDQDIHFTQIHRKDGSPIEVRRFCSAEDREVPWEDIGHGYELDSGELVILTDEELAAAAPRKTRTIDVEAFVALHDVDPIFFDHPYFLVPTGEGEGPRRAYALLAAVMAQTDRAALGRFVMRTKEYLVLMREREGRLALTTMRFHDEVRPAGEIAPGGKKAPKKQVDHAVAVIEELTADWEPVAYRDEYRGRLKDVIADKKKGKRVRAPQEEKAPAPAPDLMAALMESLEKAKAAGSKAGGRSGSRA